LESSGRAAKMGEFKKKQAENLMNLQLEINLGDDMFVEDFDASDSRKQKYEEKGNEIKVEEDDKSGGNGVEKLDF
jgi:hypothetical protein